MDFFKFLKSVLPVVLGALASGASAEVSEVRFARQYGIAYLPLMVLEHEQLVQKHALQMGLGAVETKSVQLGGTSSMNDALLSESIHFGSVAAPGIAILWDRTRGTPQEVRGVASISSIPMLLNCRDPSIKSLKDIKEHHKISMNAVKVSIYATVLQIAAAKEFGIKNYDKLDARTVALPHPDGLVALLSGGVTCQFTGPPYSTQALKNPGIHTILKANDVLGTSHVSSVMLMATKRFRERNPKTYAAVFAAYEEAMSIIREDKKKVVDIYLKMTKTRETPEEVMAMLNDPEIEFTATPKGTMAYLEFMHKVGRIKTQPNSWKDLFFEETHAFPGN